MPMFTQHSFSLAYAPGIVNFKFLVCPSFPSEPLERRLQGANILGSPVISLCEPFESTEPVEPHHLAGFRIQIGAPDRKAE